MLTSEVRFFLAPRKLPGQALFCGFGNKSGSAAIVVIMLTVSPPRFLVKPRDRGDREQSKELGTERPAGVSLLAWKQAFRGETKVRA
jgi:hypothetical protein